MLFHVFHMFPGPALHHLFVVVSELSTGIAGHGDTIQDSWDLEQKVWPMASHGLLAQFEQVHEVATA